MGKFKVGDKVRILDVHSIVGASSEGYKDNEIVTLIEHLGSLALPGKVVPKPLILFDKELNYVELAESKPTKKQRIEALEKRVGELELIVHELRGPSTIGDVLQKEFVGITEPVKTPNQLRAEIIEKAKGFVERTERKAKNQHYRLKGDTFNRMFKAEYVINTEKRTIVVLLKGCTSGKLYARSIAKCNPSDVFNEHIGKAIALGRALGLDVSKFEGAVQPTELVKGHVIRCNKYLCEKVVHAITSDEIRIDEGKNFYYGWRFDEGELTILNDTNAIYEGGVE